MSKKASGVDQYRKCSLLLSDNVFFSKSVSNDLMSHSFRCFFFLIGRHCNHKIKLAKAQISKESTSYFSLNIMKQQTQYLPCVLCFMSSNYWQKVIVCQKVTDCCITVKQEKDKNFWGCHSDEVVLTPFQHINPSEALGHTEQNTSQWTGQFLIRFWGVLLTAGRYGPEILSLYFLAEWRYKIYISW